jgi:hypothetical protein
LSLARSALIFSCCERVACDSVESELSNSDRSLAKSTFCVYVERSESSSKSCQIFDPKCLIVPILESVSYLHGEPLSWSNFGLTLE